MLKRGAKIPFQSHHRPRCNDEPDRALVLDVRLSHLLLKPNVPGQVWTLVRLEAPHTPGNETAKSPEPTSADNRPPAKARVRGLRVTIKPGTARILSLLGCDERVAPEVQQGTVTLDLPDMHENESRALVIELGIDPLPHSRPCLVEVTAVYEDVVRGTAGTSTVRARVPVAQGPDELYKPDPYVRKVVELTRARSARDRALAFLKQGEVERTCALLREHLEALRQLESASDQDVSGEIRRLECALSQALAYASPSARATSTATTLFPSSKGERPPTTIL